MGVNHLDALSGLTVRPSDVQITSAAGHLPAGACGNDPQLLQVH